MLQKLLNIFLLSNNWKKIENNKKPSYLSNYSVLYSTTHIFHLYFTCI